ncbi:MAG: hypothetical protein P8R42_05310 [Candidatus Binatia bacterium]|nr:hypothetical protein [Candidatus Binatia bacterium]
MPSSTSSSEVGGPWGRTWLLAVVLAALVLGGAEQQWRARGFTVAVSDSARLWSAQRRRADGVEQPGSVIVGASRAQYGFDLDVFADETGWPAPIQLALQGRSPLPVLEDLAADASFSGLVIVEVTERILFQWTRQREARARRRVEESHALAASQTETFEAWIDGAVGGHLAFRNPELSFDRMLGLAHGGFALVPRERWVLPDRSAKMDFSRARAAILENRWVRRLAAEEPPGAVVRGRILDEVAKAVEAIRARGGEVVLVRMPGSGALAAMEEQKFPRESFWEVLVRRVGGPAIHFEDYEELRSIATPDGSHIDFRDAPEFTRALARVLQRQLAGPS